MIRFEAMFEAMDLKLYDTFREKRVFTRHIDGADRVAHAPIGEIAR